MLTLLRRLWKRWTADRSLGWTWRLQLYPFPVKPGQFLVIWCIVLYRSGAKRQVIPQTRGMSSNPFSNN
jgi:hypothetical protein